MREYSVEMKTPLGIKRGTIQVDIVNDTISGCLNLMKHSETFHGVIDAAGNCRFTGQLVTLMRTIPYEAAGSLSETQIMLTLRTERSLLPLIGNIATELTGKKSGE